VLIFIARAYARDLRWRQRGLGPKIGFNMVEQDGDVTQ
jgi:hypothetical protein